VGQHDHGCAAFAGLDHSQAHTVGLDESLGGGEHEVSHAQAPRLRKDRANVPYPSINALDLDG
jgi:hypothetical protein